MNEEKNEKLAPQATEGAQTAVKKERRKISPVSKIIAAVSSLVFIVGLCVPLYITTPGSVFTVSRSWNSAITLFGKYALVLLAILVVFTAVFLVFEFTDHKKLSLIGLIGIWLYMLVFGLFAATIDYAAAEEGVAYTFSAGLYLSLLGVIGQIVAFIKK